MEECSNSSLTHPPCCPQDGDYVLVVETGSLRVMRHWLAGPKVRLCVVLAAYGALGVADGAGWPVRALVPGNWAGPKVPVAAGDVHARGCCTAALPPPRHLPLPSLPPSFVNQPF